MASEAGNSTSPAGRLVEFCLRSACRDKHSVAIWRRQRRTLARLPSQLAEPLFHRLLHSHLLTPPLLEYASFGFDYSILFLSLYLKLKNFCRWKWKQSFSVLYFTKSMSRDVALKSSKAGNHIHRSDDLNAHTIGGWRKAPTRCVTAIGLS
jgi:hypothetical protein